MNKGIRRFDTNNYVDYNIFFNSKLKTIDVCVFFYLYTNHLYHFYLMWIFHSPWTFNILKLNKLLRFRLIVFFWDKWFEGEKKD